MNNYLLKVCNMDMLTGLMAGCLSVITTMFGQDHTAISVAVVMFLLDTATGGYLARRDKAFDSKRFYRMIEKGMVILVLFAVVGLLSFLFPELQYLVALFPSLVAINEGYSVIENAHAIKPTIVTELLLEFFGAVKERVNKQLTKK